MIRYFVYCYWRQVYRRLERWKTSWKWNILLQVRHGLRSDINDIILFACCSLIVVVVTVTSLKVNGEMMNVMDEEL